MFKRARAAVVVLCAAAVLSPNLVAGAPPDQGCSTTLFEPGAGASAAWSGAGLRIADEVVPMIQSSAPPGTRTSVADAGRTGTSAAAVAGSTSGRGGPLAASDRRTSSARPAQAPVDWQVVDTVSARLKIPAGQRYLVRFDHAARQLLETRPIDPLTGLGHQAVDRAPDWLADALADNLGRLPVDKQDVFARLILAVQDPIVDEVAFQVARLGIGALTNARFSPALLVTNARLMYEHDKVLKYVEIVDTGSAEAGGDYSSTTRYQVSLPDDPTATSWVEIPRDVYYWFIVHPKLSDETVKDSSEISERESTYGYFWREYLFSNPNPGFDYSRDAGGGAAVYPVLGTVLAGPTVLWDGKAVDLPGGRPFTSTVALDVVGNWVSTMLPERAKATSKRPVEPNQIAYEHNGNCGEIQDLLGAAARTGLIPNVLTSNACEDHVWNEFFSAGPTPFNDWFPYQVDWAGGPTRINRDNVGYDKDRGGGKDDSGIFAWRSDGFAYDVIDRYSNACSIELNVLTAAGKPVDGARVLVFSEVWQGEGYYPATFGHTDATGTARFRVGDHQNYYVMVQSSLGNFPPEENRIARMITDSVAGQNYTASVNVAGNVRQYANRIRPPASEIYRLSVRYDATDEIVYGRSPFDGMDFTDWHQPGQIDFLVFDAVNFSVYDTGGVVTAAAASENGATGEQVVAAGDGTGDMYVVLSNEDHVVNAQIVNAEVTLYQDARFVPRAIYLPSAWNRGEMTTP